MRRSRRKLNRKRLLTILVIVSVIGVMLPERLTGRLINLVQVLIPFQDWATRSANAAGDALDRPAGATVARPAFEALRREKEALRHQLASIATRFHELEREHHQLAGIRRRGLRGGRLIPARVVATDALSWRKSRLINAGTLSGVKRAAPVTSDHFAIHLDQPEAVRQGMSVLASEALIGFVDQVGTHSARVRLLTDRETRMKVLIARLEDGKYYPLDKEFWLVGTGAPLLEIRDIDHRYVKTGAVTEGDCVLTSAADTGLPASLTVGTISRVRPDPDNGLLYRLDVEPPLKPEDIRTVFVVDPHGAETP